MNEDFVPYKLAVKLKEKGFIGNGDIGCCCGFYCEEGFNINIMYDDLNNNELLHNEYLRPSISQVLKWLREEKNIHMEIFLYNGKYSYFVKSITQICKDDLFHKCLNEDTTDEEYDTYEQAALAGIEYVLNNLI